MIVKEVVTFDNLGPCAISHFCLQLYTNFYWLGVNTIRKGSCGAIGMVEYGLSQWCEGEVKVLRLDVLDLKKINAHVLR